MSKSSQTVCSSLCLFLQLKKRIDLTTEFVLMYNFSIEKGNGMSTHQVLVKEIRGIEPHPNADAIEFALVDGYRSIVSKGQYHAGDLVVYLPESSILPDWMLINMNLWDEESKKGKLSGKNGNRVKAIRLRGEISQGICYPVVDWKIAVSQNVDPTGYLQITPETVSLGENLAEKLGIEKWEPEIPVHMSGEVANAGRRFTIHFDVENWKSFPDVLVDGEEVIFTEKIHGTLTGVSILPLKDARVDGFGKHGNILLFSKGNGANGIVFKNNEKNKDNLYVKSTRKLIERIDALDFRNEDYPIILIGETFGPKVQDLTYGKEIGLRLFAMAEGYRDDNQHFVDYDVLVETAKKLEAELVPLLYRGPFSVDVMRQYTSGKTTLGADHIREGIVMIPAVERIDYRMSTGRVALKSVSDAYIGRKGGTEYN